MEIQNLSEVLTERERRLVQNCLEYADRDPAGLPGHNLMIVIAKLSRHAANLERKIFPVGNMPIVSEHNYLDIVGSFSLLKSAMSQMNTGLYYLVPIMADKGDDHGGSACSGVALTRLGETGEPYESNG